MWVVGAFRIRRLSQIDRWVCRNTHVEPVGRKWKPTLRWRWKSNQARLRALQQGPQIDPGTIGFCCQNPQNNIKLQAWLVVVFLLVKFWSIFCWFAFGKRCQSRPNENFVFVNWRRESAGKTNYTTLRSICCAQKSTFQSTKRHGFEYNYSQRERTQQTLLVDPVESNHFPLELKKWVKIHRQCAQIRVSIWAHRGQTLKQTLLAFPVQLIGKRQMESEPFARVRVNLAVSPFHSLSATKCEVARWSDERPRAWLCLHRELADHTNTYKHTHRAQHTRETNRRRSRCTRRVLPLTTLKASVRELGDAITKLVGRFDLALTHYALLVSFQHLELPNLQIRQWIQWSTDNLWS